MNLKSTISIFICLFLSHDSRVHSKTTVTCYNNHSQGSVNECWHDGDLPNHANEPINRPFSSIEPLPDELNMHKKFKRINGLVMRHRKGRYKEVTYYRKRNLYRTLLRRHMLKRLKKKHVRREVKGLVGYGEKGESIVEYSFKTEGSYAFLAKMSPRIALSVFMKLKTRRINALLFLIFKTPTRTSSQPRHNSSSNIEPSFSHKHHPYALLEIAEGKVRFILDFGKVLKISSEQVVSDGQWHEVTVGWSGGQVVLGVDGETNTEAISNLVFTQLGHSFRPSKSHSPVHKTFMKWHVHLAALPPQHSELMPKKLRELSGFVGCMSGITFEDIPVKLLERRSWSTHQIEKGCAPTDDAKALCDINHCSNGGSCEMRLDLDLKFVPSCNCDLTSYSGATCSEDSIAYSFGGGGGLMKFKFDKMADTKKDWIAFGLSTLVEDAVLLRLIGKSDFVQVEMVKGSIFVRYNLGLMEHKVGQDYKVNDDLYHKVSFVRTGQNCTLNVDDRSIDTLNPGGQQHVVFNDQKELWIGALELKNNALAKIFRGTLVGLVFNSKRVLDLAAEGDRRVHLQGNIELDTKPLKLVPLFTSYAKSVTPTYKGNTGVTSKFAFGSSNNMTKEETFPSENDDIIVSVLDCPSNDVTRHPGDNYYDCNSEREDSIITPVIQWLYTGKDAWQVITTTTAATEMLPSSVNPSTYTTTHELYSITPASPPFHSTTTKLDRGTKHTEKLFKTNISQTKSQRTEKNRPATKQTPVKFTRVAWSDRYNPNGNEVKSYFISNEFDREKSPNIWVNEGRESIMQPTSQDEMLALYPNEGSSFRMNITLIIIIILAILLLSLILFWLMLGRCRQRQKKERMVGGKGVCSSSNAMQQKLLGEANPVVVGLSDADPAGAVTTNRKALELEKRSFYHCSGSFVSPTTLKADVTRVKEGEERPREVKEWYV